MDADLHTSERPIDSSAKLPAEPPRSWWQFSLRTLLIVTALVAIVFGLWIVPAERQRAAVAELRAKDIPIYYTGALHTMLDRYGTIETDYYGLPIDYVQSPVSIHHVLRARSGLWHAWDNSWIGRPNGSPADVELIANFHSLRRLYLGAWDLDDEGFERISQMASLEELSLGSNQVTARGVAHLAGLTKLRILKLAVSPEATAGISEFGPLENLEQLWLQRSVDPRLIASLPNFPKLRVLVFEAGDIVHGFDATNSRSEEDRVKMPKLDLSSVARLTNLEWLDLSMMNIGDRGLEQLTALKSLQHLRIHNTLITDRGLELLAQFPQLEELEIYRTRITDRGLASFSKLPSLKYVRVGGLQVTEEGETELRKRFPEETDPNSPVP